LILAKAQKPTEENVPFTANECPEAQNFRREQQKPGSGVLDVQCLHVGPTLVVRITDHADTKTKLQREQKRLV
jgi:hypothetical protein